MAFRGRGRGRGGGGGYAKPEPYILFPEDVTLPDINGVKEEKMLVHLNNRLLNYWKSSSYYLEEHSPLTKSEDNDIERYSGRDKPRGRAKRDPLSYHLKLTPAYFTQELIQGARHVQHDQRKVRWDPESGLLHKLDMLEKLEAKYGDEDEKGEKEKKEGGNEEEVEGESEDDGEFSDDGDYGRNIDFDDDEDDCNMDDDGGEDEATY